MRILYVTPQAPSPVGGGAAIRNWHLIHASAAAGHDTHVVTFGAAGPTEIAGTEVTIVRPAKRTALRRARDLASSLPDLAQRLGGENLREEVASLARLHRIDLVQVEGLEMWPSLGAISMPAIYDAHNAETALQRDMARQARRDRDILRAAYSLLQAGKLARFEAAAIHHAALTFAVSDDDRDALRSIAPDANVVVIPIGVDTSYYDRAASDIGESRRFDVVFSGTMGYRPNADAARWMLTQVWPRVRQALPAATLAIVGREPPKAIARFDGRDGITVTGEVPDDRPYMAGAGVYVLPIRIASGVRVKLLNALSMACPVVATPAACRGVPVDDGVHVAMADAEPACFAAATLRVLGETERGRSVGMAGRQLMRDEYDWACIAPRLLAAYAQLEHGCG